MIIEFEVHQKIRRQKEDHRRQLVEQIESLLLSSGESLEGAYLDHVRTGFPVHILENILHRLREQSSEVC